MWYKVVSAGWDLLEIHLKFHHHPPSASAWCCVLHWQNSSGAGRTSGTWMPRCHLLRVSWLQVWMKLCRATELVTSTLFLAHLHGGILWTLQQLLDDWVVDGGEIVDGWLSGGLGASSWDKTLGQVASVRCSPNSCPDTILLDVLCGRSEHSSPILFSLSWAYF